MALRNIRPLHVLWQDGTPVQIMDTVFSAIAKFFVLAGVSKESKLKCLGQRRETDWLGLDGPPSNKLQLTAYKSLNWHIEWTRLHSKVPGRLNSAMLLDSVLEDPNYQTEKKYVLVVVHEPLYWHDGNPINVNGVGPPGKGALITTGNLKPTNGESAERKKERERGLLLLIQKLACCMN